jgi:hypothetical protein
MKNFTLTTPYLKNNTRKLLIVPHLYSDSSILLNLCNEKNGATKNESKKENVSMLLVLPLGFEK